MRRFKTTPYYHHHHHHQLQILGAEFGLAFWEKAEFAESEAQTRLTKVGRRRAFLSVPPPPPPSPGAKPDTLRSLRPTPDLAGGERD